MTQGPLFGMAPWLPRRHAANLQMPEGTDSLHVQFVREDAIGVRLIHAVQPIQREEQILREVGNDSVVLQVSAVREQRTALCRLMPVRQVAGADRGLELRQG